MARLNDPSPRTSRAPRLHVVSGKGGTGKTTTAAALAVALARGGRRTLLCEVEGRQGIAQIFDVPQLPYEERRIAATPDGGEVWALAIEPKAALLEYLQIFYHLGRAGRVLERIGAVDFATTIAPGVRDVLLTGKVYEAVRRNADGSKDKTSRPRYDAVVLDAPPTGRIGRFLNVNDEVTSLAKVGPIHSQAASIMSLLRSELTVIHLVTILEEMPVQETQDAVAELRDLGLNVDSVVVNRVRPALLDDDQISTITSGDPRAEVLAGLGATSLATTNVAAGKDVLTGYADALIVEGREHVERLTVETEQWQRLTELDLPLIELPQLDGPIGAGELHDLAAELGEHLTNGLSGGHEPAHREEVQR